MRVVLGALVALSLCGCGAASPSALAGTIPPAELRVLFVGNSLTYTHNLPELVRALAERAGRSMNYGTIAKPGYALEDHWYDGIGSSIADLKADIVVMQQGPSSLPDHQAHLAQWSGTLAEAVRAAGGRPAMYMVWPGRERRAAFAAVHQSYAGAAMAIDGLFIPAGTAWLGVWDRDPGLQLYGPDDFHPSYLGALVAAHAIYAVLFDADPMSTPALDDNVPPATLQIIREAVGDAIADRNGAHGQ